MSHLDKIFSIKNVTDDNADEQLSVIAKRNFEHCHINLDGVIYKFLEIEFYFWSSTHEDNKLDGKPFVYKRCNPEPAQYFIHSSGIDLCLKSDSGFGGILIRSLLRIVGEKVESVVTGPIACCDALIKDCS